MPHSAHPRAFPLRRPLIPLLALALVAPAALALGDPLPDVAGIVGDLACSTTSLAALCGGGELWRARYDGPASSYDWAAAITTSPDGTRVFVTGGSAGIGNGQDFATIAYSALTGVPIWTARYNGPGNWYDTAQAMETSPDGLTVYVTGYGWGDGSGDDYITIAYDAATGVERWRSHYNGLSTYSSDHANGLAVSADGERIYVTGDSGADQLTIAYDAATGAQVWTARHTGPGTFAYDVARTVLASPDGTRVYVVGFEQGSTSDLDITAIAYDAATGAQQWIARYNGPGNSYDISYDAALASDGTSLYVSGFGAGIGTGASDYATIAYDAATGAQRWVGRYNGPANGYDVGWSMDAADGRVFVTGFSDGVGTGRDYVTLAYDGATGAALWETRFAGPSTARDQAYAVRASADGQRVYVTGESGLAPNGNDYATIAYDAATGAQAWSALADGPGTGDIGQALALSPDGTRLFVTGQSEGIASSWDFGTIAYVAGGVPGP